MELRELGYPKVKLKMAVDEAFLVVNLSPLELAVVFIIKAKLRD